LFHRARGSPTSVRIGRFGLPARPHECGIGAIKEDLCEQKAPQRPQYAREAVAVQLEGVTPAQVDQPGRTALDIGCGLGRNSRWLAAQGFTTTGIDIAPYALDRAAGRSQGQGVTYLQRDFVRASPAGVWFDLIYDSGCFHHLAPHRRISYLQALRAALAPGGLFGICTFAAGRMGTSSADADLLRQGQLRGGIGYTLDELREMFSWLEAVDAGPMPASVPSREPVFTQDFLNVALFRRPTRELT
jgi:SAM-dependent methyltransferase